MSENPTASNIRPIARSSTSRRWLLPLAGCVAGIVELLAIYVAVMSALPAAVPSHYALNGSVDATVSPATLVEAGVASLLAVGVALTAVLLLGGRSEVLEYRHGVAILTPLSYTFALVLAVPLPLQWYGILLQASGHWPSTVPPGWFLGAVLIAILLGATIVAAWSRYGDVDRVEAPMPGSASGMPPGVGPRLQCSACGTSFRSSGWLVLRPRIGVSRVPGGASYYLRCPHCGERGWHALIAWS